MEQTVWLVLGVVSTLITGGVLTGGLTGRGSPEVRLLGAAAGLGLWAVWVINSFNVSQLADCGCAIIQNDYSSLGLLGGVAAMTLVFGLYQDGLKTLTSGGGV